MSHDLSARHRQVNRQGRGVRAADATTDPRPGGKPACPDEFGMAIGRAGEWLPDFDDLFELEEEG